MDDIKWIKWLWLLLFLFIFVPLLFWGIKTNKTNRKEKIANQRTEVQKSDKTASNKETALPYQYTKPYTLKRDEVIRVYTPDGYKCDFYGGGKKYYCQPQNSEKEVWGGDSCPTKKIYPYAKYVDLSYYNEEITVTCKFTKK